MRAYSARAASDDQRSMTIICSGVAPAASRAHARYERKVCTDSELTRSGCATRATAALKKASSPLFVHIAPEGPRTSGSLRRAAAATRRMSSYLTSSRH
eukprot:977413-Pleurochrysis_carterae.AAC.1